MRYALLLLFTIAILHHVHAQELQFRQKIGLKKDFSARRESLPLFNEANGERVFFILEDETFTALRINGETTFIKLSTPRPRGRSFASVLGYSVDGSLYNVYFSSSANNALSSVTLDFEKRSVTSKLVDETFKREIYVGSASHKGKFYLITVVKGSSTMKVYGFENPSEVRTNTYEFTGTKFLDGELFEISHALNESPATYIDNTISNPLDLTQAFCKFYAFDDQLVFTFDYVKDKTIVITIDLEQNTAHKEIFFQRELTSTNPLYGRSNSFLHNRHLYQFRVALTEMHLVIKSLSSGQEINSYTIKEGDSIRFRNTAIYREGSRTVSRPDGDLRILGHTKQFLRRASQTRCALSVYSGTAGIEVTLGSYKGPHSSSSAVFASAPIFYGNSVNHVHFSYRQYSRTVSAYFKSLLDGDTFEHVKGSIPENPFDAVKKFVSKHTDRDELPGQCLLKTGNVYMLGYYDPRTDEFILRKFE